MECALKISVNFMSTHWKHAARDNEGQSTMTQTNGGLLTAESRDHLPAATYTTFQDSGHYSIKVLT